MKEVSDDLSNTWYKNESFIDDMGIEHNPSVRWNVGNIICHQDEDYILQSDMMDVINSLINLPF